MALNPLLSGIQAGQQMVMSPYDVYLQQKQLKRQNQMNEAKFKLAQAQAADQSDYLKARTDYTYAMAHRARQPAQPSMTGLAGQFAALQQVKNQYGDDSPQYKQLSGWVQNQQNKQAAQTRYYDNMFRFNSPVVTLEMTNDMQKWLGDEGDTGTARRLASIGWTPKTLTGDGFTPSHLPNLNQSAFNYQGHAPGVQIQPHDPSQFGAAPSSLQTLSNVPTAMPAQMQPSPAVNATMGTGRDTSLGALLMQPHTAQPPQEGLHSLFDMPGQGNVAAPGQGMQAAQAQPQMQQQAPQPQPQPQPQVQVPGAQQTTPLQNQQYTEAAINRRIFTPLQQQMQLKGRTAVSLLDQMTPYIDDASTFTGLKGDVKKLKGRAGSYLDVLGPESQDEYNSYLRFTQLQAALANELKGLYLGPSTDTEIKGWQDFIASPRSNNPVLFKKQLAQLKKAVQDQVGVSAEMSPEMIRKSQDFSKTGEFPDAQAQMTPIKVPSFNTQAEFDAWLSQFPMAQQHQIIQQLPNKQQGGAK